MTTSERIARESRDRQQDREDELAGYRHGERGDRYWNGGRKAVLSLTAEQASQLDEMLANWDPAPTGA